MPLFPGRGDHPHPDDPPQPEAPPSKPKSVTYEFTLHDLVNLIVLVKGLVEPSRVNPSHKDYDELMALVYRCRSVTSEDFIRLKD